MRRLRAVLRFILFCGIVLGGALTAQAQCNYTQVSATVVDPHGVPYAFAQVTADLVPAPPGAPICGGQPFSGHIGPSQTDSTGAFFILIPPNASITPGSTQWKFTVQISPGVFFPFGTGPQAFSATTTISGATQSITSTLNAAALALTVPFGGTGSSGIQVNDSSISGTIGDFNGTTPAAPSGSVNLTWQKDSGTPVTHISTSVHLATNTTPGLVQLAQDFCGTSSAPLVCGLQGNPLTVTNLQVNQVVCASSTTAFANCYQGIPPRTVAAASDTILATDRKGWVIYSNAGAVAVSLPAPPGSGGTVAFGSNFAFAAIANGGGTVTITPAGGATITKNGVSAAPAATLAISAGQWCEITTDNTIWYANCASLGTTGAVTGSGTANTITKWTSPSSVGNSSATDDGTNPTRTPNGLDTAVQGNYDEWTVDTGGVTVNKLACRSSSNKAVICPINTTSGVLGVAQATVAATGTVEICWAAKCSVVSTNATTAGHWLIPSTSVAGDVDDSGTTTEPTGTQTFLAESAVAGGSAVLTTILSPDTVAGSTGGVKQTVPVEFLVNGLSTSTSATLNITKANENPNLVWASPSSQSLTNLVQANECTASVGQSISCSYTSGNTATDLLVATAIYTCTAHANCNSGGPPTLTDTAGNTWTLGQFFVSSREVDIWYVCSARAGANTLTLTGQLAAGSNGNILRIREFSGNATSACTDFGNTANQANGGTSISVSTTGSVSQPTELVYGTVGIANNSTCAVLYTISPIAPAVQIDTQSSVCDLNADEYQLNDAVLSTSSGLSGTQTISASLNPFTSTGGQTSALIQTFKLNSTGTGQPVFRKIVSSDLPSPLSPTMIGTATNCSSSTSPAACGSSPAGSIAIPAGVNPTLTVNTTTVTANSQIFFFPDDTLGTKLGGITCNSTLATLVGGTAVTARTPGTSFQFSYNGTITTNPLCGSFLVIN